MPYPSFSTRKKQVLEALKKAGRRGIYGYSLADTTWRFGAPICELRKEGYEIETIKFTQTKYLYILKSEIPKQNSFSFMEEK